MGLFSRNKTTAPSEPTLSETQFGAAVEMAAAWGLRNAQNVPPVYDFPAVPTAVIEIIRGNINRQKVDGELIRIGESVLDKLGRLGLLGGLYGLQRELLPGETDQDRTRIRIFQDSDTVVSHDPLPPEEGKFIVVVPGIAHLVVANTPQGTRHHNLSQIGADPSNPLGLGLGVSPWSS